jgi:DNA-binding CsgD family transcriptional regulator/GAF domain-containing protein
MGYVMENHAYNGLVQIVPHDEDDKGFSRASPVAPGRQGEGADLPADRGFVAAIEAIYATAAAPARWPQALDAIAGCFGDVGAILLYKRDNGSFGTIVSPALEVAQRAYEREWWRHDFKSIRGIELTYSLGRDAVTDRHIVWPGEIENHPFQTQFLVPHGLGWFAAINISPDPHIAVVISVQRSQTKPPFSDDELAVMTRLGRHAENALRLGIRLLDTELANLGLADALSRIGRCVFMLDEQRRVMFSNAAAEKCLGSGLKIVDGRLTAALRPDRDALDDAVAAALRATAADLARPPRPVRIQRPEQEWPLTAYVVPVRSQSDIATVDFLTRARVIVLILDTIPDEPPDPALVRDLLGLTLGEARVAALVGSGHAPREAAERLGIAEATARTTLKRVFNKVGVSRQSELVSLLTKLVLR